MPPSSRHYSPAKGAASSSELVAGDAATAGSYATRDGKTRCGTRHVARTWTFGDACIVDSSGHACIVVIAMHAVNNAHVSAARRRLR